MRRGWAPREGAGATRPGLRLLLAGVALHVGLLVALGPARSSNLVQWLALGGQVAVCVVVARWGARIPAGTWAVVSLVATPLIGTLPPFYPQATLLAVPVLFLLVVFASRSLGPVVARVVTGEAFIVAVWLSWEPHEGVALAVVNVLFVGGVLVLVHRTLVRAADAQELLVSQLEQEARFDGLTGLLTRRAFEDHVDAALSSAGTTSSLLLVDLDDFKAVNDGYGHPAGDAALRHVAGLVTAGVRRAEGVVGRLGGDELGVLLVDCPGAVALDRARELVAAVQGAPLHLDTGATVALAISVGVASSTSGPRAELYGQADAALYEAKRAGRNRACGHRQERAVR